MEHGTDKASWNHNYLEFYEIFFAPLRHAQLTILEIGVLNGASLKTWEAYFPNAKIIGADIVPEAKRFAGGRIFIEHLDQSNVEQLTQTAVKHGPFDIIIEDGSHMWEHQTTSLRTLFPFVKNHGIYIVEDLHTNYGAMQASYQGVATSTCVDFLKAWLDLRVACGQIPIEKTEDAFLRTYGRAVQFITFYARACLIKKQLPQKFTVANPGRQLAERSDGRLAAVAILGHLSFVGDVRGSDGFLNLASETFTFQGLSVDAKPNVLDYRVRFADGTWSDWLDGNRFVGKRGESKHLTGVTFRLKDGASGRYALRYWCRFKGSKEPMAGADGADCTSPFGGALCGLQVELAERPG
jgi:hypothetical protein